MIDDRIKAKMKQLKLASGDTTDSTTTDTANANSTTVTDGIQQSPAKTASLGLKGGRGTMTMLSSSGIQSRLMQPTAVSVNSISSASGVTVGANGRLTSSSHNTKDNNEVKVMINTHISSKC
jgi:hypothetical protein